MKIQRPAAVVVAVLLQACAADTTRDRDAFDRSKAGTSVELPPERRVDGERPARGPTLGPRLSQGLTLEEAEQIALEVNSNILAAGEAVNAAKANVWQQSLFTNPVLSINKAEVPCQSTKTVNGTVVPNLTSDTFVGRDGSPLHVPAFDLGASSWQFGLSKDIDVSGKRVARVGNAIESERQTEAQFASAARQLKAQVRTAYAAVLVAEKNLELAREADEMARSNLGILGAGAIGGKVLEGDAATAEAAADRARVDLKQAELVLANAKIALLALLECPRETLGPLRGELPLEKLAGDLDAGSLVQDALVHNADVIAAKRAVTAAAENVKLQERTAVPDVTVQANYSRYFLDKLDSFSFGLSVPLPVFDQNRAQVAQAVANLHQAEAQESATEVSVEQSVRTDLQQIATSWTRIDAFEKEILPKARKAVKLTEASFEGGKILYLSVIAARQTFNQQRQDYATELLTYEAAMADLERLLGHAVGAKQP